MRKSMQGRKEKSLMWITEIFQRKKLLFIQAAYSKLDYFRIAQNYCASVWAFRSCFQLIGLDNWWNLIGRISTHVRTFARVGAQFPGSETSSCTCPFRLMQFYTYNWFTESASICQHLCVCMRSSNHRIYMHVFVCAWVLLHKDFVVFDPISVEKSAVNLQSVSAVKLDYENFFTSWWWLPCADLFEYTVPVIYQSPTSRLNGQLKRGIIQTHTIWSAYIIIRPWTGVEKKPSGRSDH